MRKFKLSKVTFFLIFCFLISAATLIIGAAVAFSYMKNSKNDMSSVIYDYIQPVNQLVKADTALYKISNDIYSAIIFPSERPVLESNVNKSIEVISDQLSELSSGYLVPGEIDELQKFDTDWEDYQKVVLGVVTDIKSGNIDNAKATISDPDTIGLFDDLNDEIDGLIQIKNATIDDMNKQGEITFQKSSFKLIILIGFGLFFLVVLFTITGILIGLDKKGSLATKDK